MGNTAQHLREQISELVKEFHEARSLETRAQARLTPVRYAGRVFDAREMQSLVDAALDFWLTAGRYADEFESRFSELLDVEFSFLVNSGSSANLAAFSALTSPLLGDQRLRPGDEVIAVAAGFATTLNPIIQNGMVPVFVDVDLSTLNIDIAQLEEAISPNTRAIFVAHTLGNPYEIDSVLEVVRKHNLWLIEDCCDALGSTYKGQLAGRFGHIATFSFYPAHHITMGEGGCVVTGDETLARAVRSIRDWGRDCYCAGGETNTCGKRFSGQYGTLPNGYDHKYVYSHIGYNLKVTDMQAAIGVEQLKKLPDFVGARKKNFARWSEGFERWGARFTLPCATPGSDPAWFAFPVTVAADASFSRTELTDHLNSNAIETRNLFGGNLLRQPAYSEIRHRIAPGGLSRTDRIMNDTFFLGTFPGLQEEQIAYALGIIDEFIRRKEG